MPLLGQAAVAIWSDMADPPAHDDWHSHEHLPERIGIEGFLRARRLVAMDERQPRYFVLYEVASASVMVSPGYLERLNHPTAWSQRTMAQNRALNRTLCLKACSAGRGVGALMLVMAVEPPDAELQAWLASERLPGLARLPGLNAAHLLVRDRQTERPPTEEERLRGRRDASVDALLLLEGYDRAALQAQGGELAARLRCTAAPGLYGIAHLMGRDEPLA